MSTSPKTAADKDTANNDAGNNDAGNTEVYYGYQRVAPETKQQGVNRIFAQVARRYDIMNDLMSGGLHRLWKAKFIASLPLYAGGTYLDMAGGTGDIAFGILNRLNQLAASRPDAPPSRVLISDINPAMLAEGRDRALNQLRTFQSPTPFEWVTANAESLPLPDRSLDGYTIAFGIRNVPRLDLALSEARRTLKPGSCFACLEFSPSIHPLLARAYELYSFEIIPRLGQLVAGDAESYRYLSESIRTFPTPDAFTDKIRAAGFQNVTYETLSGGIVAIHKGWAC